MHTKDQLRAGVRGFCVVLDQVPIGFYWEWIFYPKLETTREFPLDNAMQMIRNATIESSLFAIRTIDEFFFQGGRSTDIRAHHYDGFVNPGPFLATEERGKVSQRIAHLTIDRAENPQLPWRITLLIERTDRQAAPFLKFILSEAGAEFRPVPQEFDVQSRLELCSRIDEWMQKHLHKAQENKSV